MTCLWSFLHSTMDINYGSDAMLGAMQERSKACHKEVFTSLWHVFDLSCIVPSIKIKLCHFRSHYRSVFNFSNTCTKMRNRWKNWHLNKMKPTAWPKTICIRHQQEDTVIGMSCRLVRGPAIDVQLKKEAVLPTVKGLITRYAVLACNDHIINSLSISRN